MKLSSHYSGLTLRCLLICLPWLASPAGAQEVPAVDHKGTRWAVIFSGLPGDVEHEKLFRQTADAWRTWLVESLDFPTEQVLRLPELATAEAEAAEAPPPLSAEAMRLKLAELQARLKPEDALWVFTLGHGNYDGRAAWFHVAGRDPSAADFGRWLSEVRCREQVIWLTHSCSGWFVKPLSQPGRIVIAATAADDESNETEFPHALATAANLPLDKLDADKDGQVSLAEMFAAVTREVENRFIGDKRIPTEHAQLDDNGDGRGTENLMPSEPAAQTPAARIDGELAKKTYLRWRSVKP